MFESGKNSRDSRYDFERELNLLSENIINERISFSHSVKRSVRDLSKVRYSSNKRVDLNTITETVRSIAMSVNFRREEFNPEIENE